MARPKSIGVRGVLTSLLPRRVLERAAREAGLLQRRRKVEPHALFWTLVLGFGAGRERTLAGLRRAFERATRTTLVPSAFYDRFTPQLGSIRPLADPSASALRNTEAVPSPVARDARPRAG